MEKKKLTLKQMTGAAIFAAILCVMGPFSVPIGPVPISLAPLGVLLAGTILGAGMGTLSVLIYLLIGLIGLPVFSGFSGGVAKIMGPTGGYLVGYLLLAAATGLAAEHMDRKRLILLLGMVLGMAALYLLGTVWFVNLMEMPVAEALGLCVIPFLPGDAIKIVIAIFLGGEVRKRLVKAGYLN